MNDSAPTSSGAPAASSDSTGSADSTDSKWPALPAHLEKMLGEARMAVWHWDPDADVGVSSSLINELWGLKPGQDIHDSKLGFSLIHPDDVERQRALVMGAVDQGGSWHNEFRVIRPRDGKIAWLEERAHAERDPLSGKLIIEGVTWDVTERKEAELARRGSEKKYSTLFNSIDEGFAIWKVLYDDAGRAVDALLLEGNARFKALPGHADAVGKTSRAIFPEADNWWVGTFQEVLEGGAPMRFERYFEPVARWLEVHLAPLGPDFPGQVAVVFNDISERATAQEALRASEEKYRTLFTSIDEGFCLVEMIFDAVGCPVDFLYLEVNPGFVRHAGFDPVGKRVREVIPDYEQELLQHYANALRSDAILRLDHPVKGLEGQWFRTTAFRYGDPSLKRVAIVFTNITEERTSAEVLRESQARSEFLVRLEDALRPLDDPGEIRTTATRLLGEQLDIDRAYYADIDEERGIAYISPGYARGELPGIAAHYPLELFEEPLRPLRRGETLRIPDTLNEPHHPPATVEMFRAWGARSVLAAPLMKESRLRWALSILHSEPRTWTAWEVSLVRETAERTWAAVGRAQAEEDLRASERKYRALFDSIEEGFCILQLYFDASGRAVDYEYLETNPAFVRQAGIELKGKRVREAIPDFEQSWIDIYGGVALNGVPVREENRVEGLGRWFQTTAFRHGDPEKRQVAVLFTDVTDRKNAEKALLDFNAELDMQVRARTAALKESRDLLQSVLDTSLVGMSYLEAVRDENGEVVDFVIRMLNKELERESGREDLLGRYYGQEFPGIRESGLFKVMLEVLESGEPKGMDYFYPHDGFEKWFSSMFVKFGDGLVATNLDITSRMQSETDLKKALGVLELENKIHAYAEEIAAMGTWTWNTATDQLTYSENLYRLFGLEPSDVPPPLSALTRLIHPDDIARVNASTAAMLRSGERPEPLEYRVIRPDGSTRHFSNRVQNVAGGEGGHLLVGITEDITERKRAEERTRRLRLERDRIEDRQRLALLAATLNTQEIERKRIAESLHNGIGQMLYGIQLNLNQLDLKAGDIWLERHDQQKKRTTDLLGQAINESRRVSHELMPSVLEDFGLQVAVDELCKQFHGRLNVDCKHSKLPETIPQYIAVALYRTLQELMTNVVKHSEAGKVEVAVRHVDGMYELEVVDDGIGFDAKAPMKGIGLKTLREKVALLKGELHLDSGEAGTHIRVRIPEAEVAEG